jgi:hypothetical protein
MQIPTFDSIISPVDWGPDALLANASRASPSATEIVEWPAWHGLVHCPAAAQPADQYSVQELPPVGVRCIELQLSIDWCIVLFEPPHHWSMLRPHACSVDEKAVLHQALTRSLVHKLPCHWYIQVEWGLVSENNTWPIVLYTLFMLMDPLYPGCLVSTCQDQFPDGDTPMQSCGPVSTCDSLDTADNSHCLPFRFQMSHSFCPILQRGLN